MQTITINLYSFSELAKEIQEKAHQNYIANGIENPWQHENLESYKSFLEEFNIRDTGRRYGDCIQFTQDDEILELSGVRLATYFWNNYQHILYPAKIFWAKHPKTGKRYSQIFKNPYDCPFTGYCADNEILHPIYEFMKKPDNRTFEDVINECVEAWNKFIETDNEWNESLEKFAEDAEANEWKFTETGELY